MKYKKITKTLALTLGILSLPVISGNVNIDSNHIGLTIVNAAEIIDTYTDSQGITYNLYTDNTASLKDGARPDDYVAGSRPVTSNIVIPETIQNGGTTYTVTTVGRLALANTNVTSISLPSTITTIKGLAFYNSAITELTFTNNIEFAYSALSDMPNLTSVNFASTQEKISDNLLFNCTSLTNISLPDSINYVGDSAFHKTGLTTLDISNVRGVHGGAICNLPEGCQIIANGPQSFWKDNVLYGDAGETIIAANNSVTNLVIDNSVKKIAEKAFYNNTNIQSVICGTGLEQIGKYAFYGNTLLEEVYMPDTVTTLGKSAFEHCKAMKTIRLSDNIETIYGDTFWGCDSLTYLKLPNNCTKVDLSGGNNEFNCKSLMMIEGPQLLVRKTDLQYGSSKHSKYPNRVYFYDEDEDTCLKAFWCKYRADLSDVVEKPANLGQQFKEWKNRDNTLSTITNIIDDTTFVAEYVPGTVGSQYPKLTAPSVLLSSDKSTNRQNVTMTLH